MKIYETTRVFLWLCGISIIAIGAASLIAPELLAAPLGFALDNPSARNEFRANYGGMLFLLGVLTVAGGQRPDHHRAALFLVLCFTGGLVLGRLISLVVDGSPGPALYLFGALELAMAALAMLLLRCPVPAKT